MINLLHHFLRKLVTTLERQLLNSTVVLFTLTTAPSAAPIAVHPWMEPATIGEELGDSSFNIY